MSIYQELSNINIYYTVSLLYKDTGITFKEISIFLKNNLLSDYEYKWSANIRRCSIPDVKSYPINEKKFYYDVNTKKYYPLKSYLQNNKNDIIFTIENIINKNIKTIKYDLTILLSDIKNNNLIMDDTERKELKSELTKKRHKNKEKQSHGFDYQDIIIEKYEMTESNCYTSHWDSPLFNNLPVSIKCIQQNIGSIDFGDFRRQCDIDDDFLLFIGFWSGDKNNIVEEYIIKIEKDYWKSLFGNINIISDMMEEMKHISNDYNDDEKWIIFCEKYKNLYKKDKNPKINLRFKRDHKKQKRIQCGITYNNFKIHILNNCEIIDPNTI